jgi:hypothetical protein
MPYQSRLRATDEQLFSVETGKRFVVHAIYFANTTAALRRVRLHHCTQGRASGTENAMFYDVAIAANGTLIDSTRFPMFEGDSLRGMADAAGVTFTLHGTFA